MPPPRSNMIWRSVVPIGTSISPVLLTLPTSENTFVPLHPLLPTEANHSHPLLMMKGTQAQVSTLFRLLGLSHRPFSAVWVYFALGSPDFPSTEDMSAVDSPQTKAPPPLNIFMSKSNPVLKIFLPSRPYFTACSMAMPSLFTARGY